MDKKYQEFLKSKIIRQTSYGKNVSKDEIHPKLFDFQKDITLWAIRRGRAGIFLDTGLGKALDNNTNVITPRGKKKIKNVKVGDLVIGSNGFPIRVMGVYPQGCKDAYKITFSDNTIIICSGEHLWKVRTKVNKYRKQSYKTLSTKQILDSGFVSQEGCKWFIPMVKPIHFGVSNLPLDAYLLGSLLGDGCMSQNFVMFSTSDKEIINKLSGLLPDGVKFKKAFNAYDYRITGPKNGGHIVNPLVKILKELNLMGKKSENKFIPVNYKYAKIKDRIKLLQGLMDTDGYISKEGNSSYCTTSKQLAEDVLWLVQSLGGKSSIRTKKTMGQLAYIMSLALPNEIMPITLERKLIRYKPRKKYFPIRGIKKIEQCGQRNMTCISVDSEDNLYVIEHCILTHNTFMQLEWARLINEKTLIIAPLSIARQTIREAKKIDLDVDYVRDQSQIKSQISITNYEMVDHFDFSEFRAIVLDESSILKAIGGKTKRKLIKLCHNIPYKLSCTATPAPNDYIELGNQVEWLGVCKASEMLAMFFVNANKEHTFYDGNKMYWKKGSNAGGTEWRIKHHAETAFFRWLTSWAFALTKPSDLGYSDEGFILPPLNIYSELIHTDYKPKGKLFFTHIKGIKETQEIRKTLIPQRLELLIKLIDNNNGFGINLQYDVDKKPEKRISEKILSGKLRTRKGAQQAILSQKQVQNRSGEKEGIQSEILSREQTQMEEKNYNTTETIQQKSEREIQERFKTSRTIKGSEQGMDCQKSEKEESSKIEKVWHNPRSVRDYDEETKSEMCNLWNKRHWESNNISNNRSRSHIRKGSGSPLSQLQSGDRKISGQSKTIRESDQLFEEQWIVWCGLNKEQKEIEKALLDKNISFSSVYGALKIEEKIKRIENWVDGKTRVLISKPKVCGFGLNFWNAHKMVFFGLNYSWEQFYQCIRRQWRYMQKSPVDVYIIMSDIESSIYQNIMRKDAMAKRLRTKLIENIKELEKEELKESVVEIEKIEKNKVNGENWIAFQDDASVVLKELEKSSIDLSVYSPPFADLYTYTNSEQDLGNCKDWNEFFNHYSFIIREIFRTTKQGRLTCVHTSDIPAMAQKDGYIGVKDFPGKVIEAYEKEGWIFNGRAFVQKNPQAQAIRTHSKALLFVQLRRDSADSRPALVDQILIFKKPGINEVPVLPVENGELDNETWIQWANGIWTGISETNTLQYAKARGKEDEKHICPLQLETIERCIKLYSNPGETVLTPFGGIGSEAYQAVKYGRKAILIELKKEYFKEAVKNLKYIELQERQGLFFNDSIKTQSTN